MIAPAIMAVTAPAAVNGVIYWAPPVLLLVALWRNLRVDRKAALLYFLLLAAWLGHLAILQRETSRLPATVRIEPPDLIPFAAPQITEVSGRSVLQVQAPVTLDWTLQGDERRFHFNYGFIPGAYEQGTTNGAGLTVTLRRAGLVRTIFNRVLNPRELPGDRGVQQASLVLPPVAPGEQLTVTIDTGPGNDASWDWLHLSNVGFQRSAAFLPEQFPSFNRVPDTAEAPFGAIFQNRERAFFIHLHAPSSFDYALHGSEKTVRFNYGFLPGAYQNGNTTDGARFLVLVRSAAGAERILFDRELQPAGRPEDRNPHPAELALGPIAAGDRLAFRIEPGPSGSNACDWTYVSTLSLE